VGSHDDDDVVDRALLDAIDNFGQKQHLLRPAEPRRSARGKDDGCDHLSIVRGRSSRVQEGG
jgi:hypothetical protein